jgi:hypothetical protein
MTKLEELASRVFQARNITHREHLKTDSYSKHIALGSFYDDVIESIDEIIEVHQGRHELIGDFTVQDKLPKNVTAYLIEEAAWIENNRNKFDTCPAVLNLIDSLAAIYLRAVYKLTNLQ